MVSKQKIFLITIDTEADNQWDNEKECTTQNALFLPRFQELAEKYEFKPVWLTTYEMANDSNFVNYFKQKQELSKCEIGMHLHAWNNPPFYEIKNTTKERSFLVEYPIDVMDKKIKELDKLLTEKFTIKPISHRAGRWAMNENYYKLLEKYNYKIDCSVTPHINWKNSVGATGKPGTDYSKEPENTYFVGRILEVPMTISKIHKFQLNKIRNFKQLLKEIYFFIFGKKQWIRPDKTFSFAGMKKLINKKNKNSDYIMFMIHSSELMPNGSPNFCNDEDIERLYENIEKIFNYVKSKGYIGLTLKEFYDYNERNTK